MSSTTRVTVAIVVGCLLGFATLNMESLSDISANPILGGIQISFVTLLFPGLIGSMAFAGNVHAFSLGVAGFINAILYLGLVWITIGIIERFRLKRRNAKVLPEDPLG
ncbi:hypothetical protein ACFPT7_15705 [Acidicapsa dinghuensis]|uniref:Uncharacterized protein n=1 Tax=Acidicapsa dinghuensis TaxID=2218256 RepID=A0ABW1EK17_9BACT|nr:hypothetical protein [Acidicapsa dinghuensis]